MSLALAALAVLMQGPVIERDIGGRIAERLSAEGLGWARVSVDGRAAVLSGTAPDEAARQRARALAESAHGVSGITDMVALPPMLSPFEWGIALGPEGVRLKGHVPSDGTGDQLVEAIGRILPDVPVSDEAAWGRGAPARFGAAAGFLIARLQELAEAELTLSDTQLSVSGTARDDAAFGSVAAAARAELPAGYSLARLDIRPPRADRFVWSAEIGDGVVRFTGAVPSEATRRGMMARIGDMVPGIRIEDGLILASGAPEGFEEDSAHLLDIVMQLSEGRARIDADGIALSGRARTVDDYETLVVGLREPAPSGRSIVGEVEPAVVSPFVWRAEKTPREVVLSGFVPSEGAVEDIVETALAEFPEQEVRSRMRVADGEPRMDWIGATRFALRQLTRLGGGTVAITDRTLEIAGEARDLSAYDNLRSDISRTLPASLELGQVTLTPPVAFPFRFSAEYAAGRLTLAGYVPDEAAARAIGASAARKFGAVEREEALQFAGGAPDHFIEAAEAGVEALSRLVNGRFELVGTALTLEGMVFYEAAAERIAANFGKATGEGFTSDVAFEVVPEGEPWQPELCQEAFTAALERNAIQFGSGDATILPDSLGLLDRLAAAALRCPDSIIEIAGHTDSPGGPNRNRALSLRRAEAVKAYLVEAGVKPERLTTVGHGEARPIASNDTEEGRARNRRIEMTVKSP